MNMNMYGFSMMRMGTSNIGSMRSLFDSNIGSQLYGSMGMMGGNMSNSMMGMLGMSGMNAMSGMSGVLDSQSIIQGLGFGAENIPQPPSFQDTMQLMQMYQNSQNNSESSLNGITQNALAKKEQVFQSNHYEFDKNGNPVLNEETGKPQVYEGAEDMTGKLKRMNWERQL